MKFARHGLPARVAALHRGRIPNRGEGWWIEAFPRGLLRAGMGVVSWGANLAPGSKAVLAHEKAVPKDGGMVLLQDGETVKPMTAQEFQVAPKSGK